MIRILKGNHRRLYFQLLSECFNDYRLKLCIAQSNNCNSCKYADVCNDLQLAEDYCNKLALKLSVNVPLPFHTVYH